MHHQDEMVLCLYKVVLGVTVVALASKNIFEIPGQSAQTAESINEDVQFCVAGVLHDTCTEALKAAHTVRGMLCRVDYVGFSVSKDESDAVQKLADFNPNSLASRLSLLEWSEDEVSRVMSLPHLERDVLMEASETLDTSELLCQIDQLKSTLTPTVKQLRERLAHLMRKVDLQELSAPNPLT